MKKTATPPKGSNLRSKPARARAEDSMQRLVGLRWLIVEHFIEQYDDRDKEWDTRTWEDERVLQYFDGKRWREVPTVKRKAKPNDKSSDRVR